MINGAYISREQPVNPYGARVDRTWANLKDPKDQLLTEIDKFDSADEVATSIESVF